MIDLTTSVPVATSYAALMVGMPLVLLSILGLRAIFDEEHPSQTQWIWMFLFGIVLTCAVVGMETAGTVVARFAVGVWGSLVRAIEMAI